MQATTWKEIKSFHYCWGLLNVSSLSLPPPHRLQNKVEHIFMELDSGETEDAVACRADIDLSRTGAAPSTLAV